MNVTEVHTHCKSLEALMEEQGFFRPEASFRVNWLQSEKFAVHLEMRTDPNNYDTRRSEYFYDDDPVALFARARHWIRTQPNARQLRQDKFLETLAHLVEEADYLKMDPAPLRQVFAAMTTNLLEHRT